MPNGYAGKVLNVDLSSQEVWEEGLDWDLAADYIGGRGLAAKMIFDKLKPGADPLGPENVLVLATGPLTGTQAPACGRSVLASKSPLTGTIFDSNSGGLIGPELKRAGYDAVIISGSSEEPVYLAILDGRAELRPAGRLWGRTVSETVKAVKRELGDPKARVACIGPAGEKCVLLANVMCEPHRAFGRGGLGAVMGSKRLKAIAVRGRGRVEVANPHAFKRVCREVREILARNPLTGDLLGRYGTGCLTTPVNKAGILPTRNFRVGFFEGAESITGEAVVKELRAERRACYGCPISCARVLRRPDGREIAAPEYETMWAFGAQCDISDLRVIAEANELANEYGLDTISLGNAIGFLMECYERGLIGPAEAGGLELTWGRAELLPKLVKLTARREGVGAFLALGVKRMSECIKGSRDFAMHVKGLELPAYDPRGAKGMGLAYATSNRGGCHLRAYLVMSEVLSMPRYLDPVKAEGKAKLVKKLQDIFAVLDSIVMCKFTSLALFETLDYEPKWYARLLTTATGFYFDEEEFLRAGERIYNLERFFNVREGFDRAHDTLPLRLLKEPMPYGPAEGQVVELEAMLDEYYALRLWDPRGRPTDRVLMRLGIIREPRWPKLQVALDLRDLEEALRIAELAFAGGADWIEAGTPLIKSAGMEAVRALRRKLPGATIVADLKTLDTGWLETELAAQAGADVVAISGLAHNNTIKDAVGCARKYGVKIMVDLLQVPDPVKRAKELEALGVDYICAHTGIDVQRDRAEEIDRKVATLARLAKALKIPLAAAGGIRADTAHKVVRAGVKIVIVGGAITRAADPRKATELILKAIKSQP